MTKLGGVESRRKDHRRSQEATSELLRTYLEDKSGQTDQPTSRLLEERKGQDIVAK